MQINPRIRKCADKTGLQNDTIQQEGKLFDSTLQIFRWLTDRQTDRQTDRPLTRIVKESKSNAITGLDRPVGFQDVEAPRFQDNRHMKVVRLSTLRTGRLYHPPPRKYSGYAFLLQNSNDTIGNRTRDLPVCSAVPQPTSPPAACPITRIVRHRF
jgi:hypothetical protein